MNILITGASGFVGPVLAEQIKKKFPEANIWGSYYLHHEFFDFDHDLMKSFNLDLQNYNAVKAMLNEIKPQSIYHLAAQSSVKVSWKNPQLTFNVNVGGTLNLLEAVREYDSKMPILIIGSSEEYGVSSKPSRETDVCKPINPYGISKLTQENLGILYQKAYGLNINMTRTFNHIGSTQIETFVIPDWCKQIAEIEILDKESVIKVGNLEIERDFSHVEDVCRAYIDIVENGVPGETYNVGSGNTISLRHILEKLVSFSEKEILIEVDPDKVRPADTPFISCDRKKLDTVSAFKFRSIDDTLFNVLKTWREKLRN